jgi:hypothetical protein
MFNGCVGCSSVAACPTRQLRCEARQKTKANSQSDDELFLETRQGEQPMRITVQVGGNPQCIESGLSVGFALFIHDDLRRTTCP